MAGAKTMSAAIREYAAHDNDERAALKTRASRSTACVETRAASAQRATLTARFDTPVDRNARKGYSSLANAIGMVILREAL